MESNMPHLIKVLKQEILVAKMRVELLEHAASNLEAIEKINVRESGDPGVELPGIELSGIELPNLAMPNLDEVVEFMGGNHDKSGSVKITNGTNGAVKFTNGTHGADAHPAPVVAPKKIAAAPSRAVARVLEATEGIKRPMSIAQIHQRVTSASKKKTTQSNTYQHLLKAVDAGLMNRTTDKGKHLYARV